MKDNSMAVNLEFDKEQYLVSSQSCLNLHNKAVFPTWLTFLFLVS